MSAPWKRHERIGSYGFNVVAIGFPSRAVVYAICGAEGPVYVGSTKGSIRNRIQAHLRAVNEGSHYPIHEWMAKNRAFEVRFLEEVDVSDRHECEKKWVANFGDELLNVTDGGPGLSGHSFAGTGHAEKIAEKLKRGTNCKCENCGSEFWRKPRDIKLGHSRFCSRSCYQIWQRGRPKKRAKA